MRLILNFIFYVMLFLRGIIKGIAKILIGFMFSGSILIFLTGTPTKFGIFFLVLSFVLFILSEFYDRLLIKLSPFLPFRFRTFAYAAE